MIRTGAKALGSELLWVTAGQLAAALGLLATIKFLTTSLRPEEYGEVALALTVSVLVNQLVAGPLTSSFVRFFSPAVEGESLGPYLAALKSFAGRFARASALVVGAAILIALTTPLQWATLAIPALLFSSLWSTEQSLDGLQNAARHRSVVALHLALGAWLKLALAVLSFRLFGPSSIAALWAFVGATTCVLISQTIFFRKEIYSLRPSGSASQDVSSRWVKQMVDFSRPFALWGLFHWAVLVSDRYALSLFRGTSEVGLYNVAYQIGYYPVILLSSVGLQLLVPVLYEMAGDATDAGRLSRTKLHTKRIAYGFAATSMMAAAVMGLLHRPIFRLLVGESFQEGSKYVPFLLLAGGLFAAGQIAAQSPLLEMNARGLLAPKVLTATTGIALNLAGAYFFGIDGVVAAGVLFSAAYFVWMVTIRGTKAGLSVAPRADVEPIGQELAGPLVEPTQPP